MLPAVHSTLRRQIVAVLVCLSFCLSCDRFSPPKLVTIPLLSCLDLPCIEVSLNGSPPLRMLLDFGNRSSYISTATAHKVKLPGFSPTNIRVGIGSVILNDSFLVGESNRDVFPPGDGGLSYELFMTRLVILDIPHRRLQLSANPIRKMDCPAGCSPLMESRLGDFVFGPVLTTEGFAVENKTIKARIDTLYPGSVIAFSYIEGLPLGRLQATGTKYDDENLLFARSVPVSFLGQSTARSALLMRYEYAYQMSGPGYNAIVGLSLFQKYAFAFDFRDMKIWIHHASRSSGGDREKQTVPVAH